MSTPTIINLALHSTLLSLLGWLLVRWCLRDARQRSWAAVCTLTVAVLAPVVIAWWPQPTGLVIPEAPAVPLVTWKPDWTMNLAPTAEPVVHEVEIKAAPWTWLDAMPALKWLWLAGIVGFAAAQLLRTWRVTRCQSYPTPCVIGLIRPVIFVPEGFKCTLNDDQWRWLLAHEGEHVRARDPLVAWMLGWVRVLLWWNPFVHSLINQWSQAREEVCDAVATTHDDTERYADFLIDIAAHGRCDFAIAMAASRPARRLRARLEALIEKRRVCERISLGFGVTLVTVMTLGAALVSCGGVKESQPPANQSKELVVSVKSDGTLTVDEQIVSREQLTEKLTAMASKGDDQRVIIRAESDTSYDTIIKVLDAAQSVGLNGVAIATPEDRGIPAAHRKLNPQHFWLTVHIVDITLPAGDDLSFVGLPGQPSDSGVADDPRLRVWPPPDRAYGIVGVVSQPKLVAMLPGMLNHKGSRIRTLPGTMVTEYESATLAARHADDTHRVTISALRPNMGIEISLRIRIEAGLPPFDTSVIINNADTVWFGSTLKDNAQARITRFVRVTAQLIDPIGVPMKP